MFTYAGNLAVGGGGTGFLTIENGGTVSGFAGFLGNEPGGMGTVTVGSGSTWTLTQNVEVGRVAGTTGSLTIENGGTVNSAGFSVGGGSGGRPGGTGTVIIETGGLLTSGSGTIGNQSSGMVTVDGTWTDRGLLTVGSGATGTLTVENGGLVTSGGLTTVGNASGTMGTVDINGGTLMSSAPGGMLVASMSGSTGAVNVTNGGSLQTTALTIGSGGTGDLTISNGASVTATGGTTVANTSGSSGTVDVDSGGTLATSMLRTPPGGGTAQVNFNGGTLLATMNNSGFVTGFSGTELNIEGGGLTINDGGFTVATDNTSAFTGVGGLTKIGSGTVILDAPNTYMGQTIVEAGTLAAGGVDVFSADSDTVVESGGTINLQGFNQTLNNGLTNAGTVVLPASPGVSAPGTTLTVAGNYVGKGGDILLDTFLGTDNSPSDKLVLEGGTATGSTMLTIRNTTGPGAQTTQNGILVVDAIDGATASPTAFVLADRLRPGALDYRLFEGSVSGSDPAVANDWFLRDTFAPPSAPTALPPAVPVIPGSVFPTDPPPEQLPPRRFPIIGPELATYGVVQPIARQMGFTMLGTLHERIGDTLTDENAGPDAEGWGRSGWARFFGQQIDNQYKAFADPSTTGRLFGVQAGFDIFRGRFFPGHRDAAGLYFAYGDSTMDVDGLVTNQPATGYVRTRTGTVNLYGYSGGAYWTHYGPGGWYIDGVVQGTAYSGNATTQDANLPTNGSGIITSLEVGYPIPLPLGPRFILEPQGQILWQHTSFRQANDGLGPVGLGSTSGATGRLGLRAQSTIATPNGMVWQPYARANLWQNWGGEATTTFGRDAVPLLQQSTQLEFAAGVTAKVNDLLSFYAQAGYEFSVGGATDGGTRQGVKGDIGLRLTFGRPTPLPPPVPLAAPAPAAARSYLVFFDWDKATLTDRARQIIREAAANSTHVQYTRIEVNGHTDTSGTPDYNMGLSFRRANAVAGELMRNGVPRGAIAIRGFGQTLLLVPTGPGVREPQNRRVEIIVR